MNTIVSKVHIPPAMTAFDIVSTSKFIISYEAIILPLYVKLTKKEPKPLSELQRLGVSKAFVYVAQMEFFGCQTPDGLKSMGMRVCLCLHQQ